MRVRLACSLCLAASLAAVDLDAGPAAPELDLATWLRESPPFVQLRLGLGSVPKPAQYSFEIADTNPVQRYDDRVDASRATELSYGIVGGRLNPAGWLFGGELCYAWTGETLERRTQGSVSTPAPADAAQMTYRTLGVNALAGVGLRVRPRVHLELLGVLGAGAVDIGAAEANLQDHADGGGWYWNAGVRAGAYVTWRRLVVGAHVTGLYIDYRDIDAGLAQTNQRVRWEDSEGGVAARLELGYHIPLY